MNPEYMRQKAKEWYHKNKEKAAEKNKAWRLANAEDVKEKQRERKRTNKLKAIAYLGGCCGHCSLVFHPSVYEFHHKDPETKIKDPSKMLNLSWEKIQQELDKCILLCANCHRFLHHKDNY